MSAVTEFGDVVEVGLTAVAPELLSVTTAESEVLGVSDTIAPASPVTLDEDSVVTTGCCADTGVVEPESSGAIALFSPSEVTAALSGTGEVSSTETDGFS
ncbi:hypothetical protein QUB40_14980, partial [Microcoleus sp. AT9_A2]|uniref:hypothetical protein n=1 Tax=Microcoleus sp. AT9_A2 TaxID=2818624 RepID=UPI002FD34E01